MATCVADSEQLLLDGIAIVEIVLDRHVVAGSQPSVGVSVEEDASRIVEVIRAAACLALVLVAIGVGMSLVYLRFFRFGELVRPPMIEE